MYITNSDADSDFMYLAAHETGHEILKNFGTTGFSYEHKNSSTMMQNSKEKGETGSQDYYSYPNEIDLMYYFYNEPFFKDFPRVVASESDALGLLWLSKLKIR